MGRAYSTHGSVRDKERIAYKVLVRKRREETTWETFAKMRG
jgi:hypothetical protein